MKLRNVALAAFALSLAAAPVVAQVSLERASAPAEGENLQGTSQLLLAGVAVVAIVAGIIIISDDDDDEPTSP